MPQPMLRLALLALSLPLGFAASVGATTIGGAMGNGSADARPIVWKNRDGGQPTGSKRHFLSHVTDRTHRYLGVHPSDRDPRMGVNELGISFGNATARPFDDSQNYDYANTQAFKQFVLGETTNLAQIRQAIDDNILGTGTDWPDSIALMPGISDASGRTVLWELGDAEYYEYDLENPTRLAQSPWQIYARDNNVHTQTDHTDDWSENGERYVISRNQLIENAQAGGSTIVDMIRIARIGEPHFDDARVPSRPQTSATMIAHGVLQGEDPRIVTMWNALGQPDYTAFVPVWEAIGDQLSPRVSTNDLDTSISGASEKLVLKREAGGYDAYINALLEPMEANFFEVVAAARTRWFQLGFEPDEALRIHSEASETAWYTMNSMAAGVSRSLNVTPQLTGLSAAVTGLSVTFGATASDADGGIAAYDWDFGDGTTAASAAAVHAYAQAGTYLVRCRVTDTGGSRNSKWIYLTIGAVSEPPVVTVTASDAVASEPADSGAFTLARTGPTTDALAVNLTRGGSAVEGNDYQSIGATVTIPAGAASVIVSVMPIDDAVEEDSETVTVTLAAGAGYSVAAPANATVSIADDERIVLIPSGAVWRYFKGTSFPGPTWNSEGFDDSGWSSGATSIGYGDGDDATVLVDMPGGYLSVYLRHDFSVDDAGSVLGLSLDVDYDDGFVAFLNGTEVARSGVDPGQDHTSEAANHEAGQPEVFDLGPFVWLLRNGVNVLSIEIHNQDLNSSDLTIVPVLNRLGGLGGPACSNSVDDDGDGLFDYPDDPGCDDAADASEQSDALECDDGFDDDGDGLADYPADPGCSAPTDVSERDAALACDDGNDNDNDGTSDFPGDPGCDDPTDASEKSPTLVCDDGADNDGDALADHPNDPGCDGPADASEHSDALECDDGVDDDGDGLADFPADPGCEDPSDPSESSPTLPCDDGLDDDADGLIDFPADPGCASPTDVSERDATLACDDGIDNDGDGLSDFPGDPGCDDPADTSERSPSLVCDDGSDNDGDGLIDFPADPGCDDPTDPIEEDAVQACGDGLDNDGDGLIDENDPGCDGPADTSERSPSLVCDDGSDNDGDGVADVPADPGCSSPADASERDASLACDDGNDNDNDGTSDFPGDPGCDDPSDVSEKSPSLVCDDGADNDGDALADHPNDPGCAGPADPSENSPALPCDDGLDDDGDGLIDFPTDPGCTSPTDGSERDAALVCDDGLDNDGDGLIDYPADAGCDDPSDSSEADVEFYTLSVEALGPGKVTIQPSRASYAAGTTVTLKAHPGRRFVAWSGDLTGSSPNVTFAIGSDMSITATFVK